jgi:hypothetical protein
MTREFAPWPEPHLVIDTASLSPEEAIMKICQEIRR